MKSFKTFLLLSLLATTFATHALAYNDVACAHWRDRLHHERSFPTSFSTSTTKYGTSFSQFSTSWGHCSGLALREQREEFVAENSDELSQQSAQGRGESLEALAQLSGCQSLASRVQFNLVMQKNFTILYFNDGKPANATQISKGIERLLQVTPELRTSCPPPVQI